MRLAASCPACGAPVGLDVAETAVRCDRCSSAHLVLRAGGTSVAGVAGRTSEEEATALARAALGDEMRRRGRSGPEPVVDGVTSFEVPVRVLVARLHEAAVVRGAAGDPESRVTTRLVEVARPALRDLLGLPTAPPLGEIDARGLSAVSRRSVPAPPFDADEAAFETDAERLCAATAGPAPSLARHAVAVPLARVLVLRPCLLVSVSSDRVRAAVLVDGAARQATGLLSRGAAEALLGEIAERPLPASPAPSLRPMRCPQCGSAFPLDRQGQLRICPACRRAFLVAGRRLLPIAYVAELPPTSRGRVLVPAWRFEFALEDPRDGLALSSLAAVRSRCGEAIPEQQDDAGGVDVPAFLPADRRRERAGVQEFLSLPPATFPHVEGPARGEAGFPEPRLVGALGPDQAASVVRHAFLAALGPRIVARASARRLKALLFDAPLRLSSPRLVLRALRRNEVETS